VSRIGDALHRLEETANRKTAFIGLGNRDRGDDAVGLRFAEDLRRLNPNRIFSEEQGLEEVVLDILMRKDVHSVIFVDTCDFGAEPGEIAFLQSDDIGDEISTHKVPLAMLMALIQKEGKKAYFVGIQPESLDFGKDISEIASASLKRIEEAVEKKLRL